jgi:large subunit ribosomal protein L25
MKFVAFERAKQGTGASRRLRNSGRTPGIVYGGTGEPSLIELDHNALWHAIKKEAFHAPFWTWNWAASREQGFAARRANAPLQAIDPAHRLPARRCQHQTAHESATALTAATRIPLRQNDGCIANHVVTEIEVLCLPADLPEFIAVDLSTLKKGKLHLHLADVVLPKGVTAVTHGKNNPVLVSVVAIAGAEVAPAADAAAGSCRCQGWQRHQLAKAPAAKAPAAKKSTCCQEAQCTKGSPRFFSHSLASTAHFGGPLSFGAHFCPTIDRANPPLCTDP